jgi:mannose-6-phosphate isomerase-like protein (cupin superfamily)
VTEKGYGVARIDDLESFPIQDQQGLTWRPVRRHFGISSFGVNAYTATEAGQRVVEEHREQDGHDELYVVLSGRATFTLEGEEHDAPAGTLVHCPPGTLREAFAAEPGTTVLGIGAKPGEVFQPSGWEWVFAGFSRLAEGNEAAARRELEDGIATYPDAWQGHFNMACLEARQGNKDEALAQLQRAAELEPGRVPQAAAEDEDFDSLREDERFLAITRQTSAAGSST